MTEKVVHDANVTSGQNKTVEKFGKDFPTASINSGGISASNISQPVYNMFVGKFS